MLSPKWEGALEPQICRTRSLEASHFSLLELISPRTNSPFFRFTLLPFASSVFHHYSQDLEPAARQPQTLGVIQAKCKRRENLTVSQLAALMAILVFPKEYFLEYLVSWNANRYSTKKVFPGQVNLRNVGVNKVKQFCSELLMC